MKNILKILAMRFMAILSLATFMWGILVIAANDYEFCYVLEHMAIRFLIPYACIICTFYLISGWIAIIITIGDMEEK